MTDPAYTHLVILADRTGSMGQPSEDGRTKAADTTAGVRQLLSDQAGQPGKLTVSLVQFMYPNRPGAVPAIDRVAWFAPADHPSLRGWSCVPYGATPLLDAVGTVITDTGDALAAMAEADRPSRVIFVIATDGQENQSREYSLTQVKNMIARQRDQWKWDFLFIGVGIDGFAEASGMGVAAGSTVSVGAASTHAAYAATSGAVTRTRTTGKPAGYSSSERDQAGSK